MSDDVRAFCGATATGADAASHAQAHNAASVTALGTLVGSAFLTAVARRAKVVSPGNRRLPSPFRIGFDGNVRSVQRSVSVSGLGVVSVFGTDAERFRDELLSGNTGIAAVRGFALEGCRTTLAGEISGFDPTAWVPPMKLRRLDRTGVYAVAATKLAFADARRYVADSDILKELKKKNQIVLQYSNDDPNGSTDLIAAICNEEGNVMGMMPHPERASEGILNITGSNDAIAIFHSLTSHLKMQQKAIV